MRGIIALACLILLGNRCGGRAKDSSATRTSSETTAGLAAVNGTTLYYEIAGHGAPVVLIEGANMDRRQWDDQFEVFAQDFRVIRYDVRGFGSSGRITGPFTMHEDLAALLRSLGIARASFVGLSLGGRIAIDLALTHPEMVNALVLVAPGLSGYQFADTAAWVRQEASGIGRRDTVAAAEAWLTSPYMTAAMARPELAPRLRALALANSGAELEHAELEPPLDPPATRRLHEIGAPTLVIYGSRDDPDIGHIVDSLRVGVRAAQVVRLHDVGHVVNIERPAEFNRLVVDFLKRHKP